MTNSQYRSAELALDPDFFVLLTGSYARLVGAPLVLAGQGPDWLYLDAAFPVLAHDTAADPHFIYANKAAQACFGYSWTEFTALPSRLSAEAPDRDERQRLLDAVKLNGFISDYRGVRIAKSGRRFWIEQGVVWQLIGSDGVQRGQAATFPLWRDA